MVAVKKKLKSDKSALYYTVEYTGRVKFYKVPANSDMENGSFKQHGHI